MTAEKKQEICKQADLRRKDLIRILQDMVRLPSVTHPPGGEPGQPPVLPGPAHRRRAGEGRPGPAGV